MLKKALLSGDRKFPLFILRFYSDSLLSSDERYNQDFHKTRTHDLDFGRENFLHTASHDALITVYI